MARFERLIASTSGATGELVQAFPSEQHIRSDERGRLSRELHDSTSQLLVALRLKMAGLTRAVSSPVSVDTLSDLYETIDELHREIRAVAIGRESMVIADGGLPIALRQMILRFAIATDMDVRFDLAQPYLVMPRPMKIAVYRITQEALANACRHGQARNALVQLQSTSKQVTLRVRDDGTGIAKCPREGFGLRNMRDRAAMFGGKLRIKSTNPGTQVELVIPRSSVND